MILPRLSQKKVGPTGNKHMSTSHRRRGAAMCRTVSFINWYISSFSASLRGVLRQSQTRCGREKKNIVAGKKKHSGEVVRWI